MKEGGGFLFWKFWEGRAGMRREREWRDGEGQCVEERGDRWLICTFFACQKTGASPFPKKTHQQLRHHFLNNLMPLFPEYPPKIAIPLFLSSPPKKRSTPFKQEPSTHYFLPLPSKQRPCQSLPPRNHRSIPFMNYNCLNSICIVNAYNNMEQSREKVKKQNQPRIFEEQEQHSGSYEAQPSRLKKKIKKLHRKQKSREVVNLCRDQTPPLSHLIASNPSLFTNPNPNLPERYRHHLLSRAHVRQILSKEQGPIFSIKQADCQQETWRYLEFLREVQESIYEKMGILCKDKAFCLSLLREYRNDEARKGSTKNVRFLSNNEDYLYHKRTETRERVRGFIESLAEQLGYSEVLLGEIELQILTLCKINNQFQHEILQKMRKCLNREDLLHNCQPQPQPNPNLHSEYIKVLIIKNLGKAFIQSPIDFFNYHKSIETYQDNNFSEQEFDRIQTFAHFKKYIFNKKPKLNKCSKYHLRTPCSACFSDFSEMSNPIQKCPECPIRIHKNCQKVENRCHRCRFGRTANEEKSQTGYCYICYRPREKGLMIRTVTNRSPHHFAHNFCLLVHHLWRIEDEEIKGTYVQVEERPSPCRICQKRQGILLDCGSCGERVHGMCAYLHGYSFRMEKREGDSEMGYRVLVDCCTDRILQERLMFERRFKLNYEKLIFRQNKELFDYIERVS